MAELDRRDRRAAQVSRAAPVEMRVYPTGGHGNGLRRTDKNVTTWPDRVADGMKTSGWLQPAK